MTRPEQLDRLAGLLGGLSDETSELLLSRLDDATRSEVGRRLSNDASEPVERPDLLMSFRKHISDYELRKLQSMHRDRVQHPPQPGIPIEFIYGLDDDSLDQLLQSVPAPVTIRMLRCSPKRFVERVMKRLSDQDAEQIAQEIEQNRSIELEEMTNAHQEFLSVVESLTDQGQLSLSSSYGRT